jgi:NAD(P)-dependent dehydrogenase (short-subunit alcohol dehydrogenase family)
MSITHRNAVVVTGASSGIGRACALELDRAGYQVFATVRSIWADADQGKTAKAAVKSGLQMQLERQREPFIRQK